MRTVGRSETIVMSELGINLSAKIDTGAYGNAMHVDRIEISDGILLFYIGNTEYRFEKYKTVSVRNSFGVTQDRYSIITYISIGTFRFKARVSLTNRKDMKHPMLIGRRFLRKFNFLVDVGKKNINSI